MVSLYVITRVFVAVVIALDRISCYICVRSGTQWDRRRDELRELSAGRLHCCLSTGKCPLGASYNVNGSPEENGTDNGSYGIYHTVLIQMIFILPDMTTGRRLLNKSFMLLVLRTCFLINIEIINEACVYF